MKERMQNEEEDDHDKTNEDREGSFYRLTQPTPSCLMFVVRFRRQLIFICALPKFKDGKKFNFRPRFRQH